MGRWARTSAEGGLLRRGRPFTGSEWRIDRQNVDVVPNEDGRNPERIELTLEDRVAQRI